MEKLKLIKEGHLAGLIDGEGSILLSKHHKNEYRSPAITIPNSTWEIISSLKKEYGGNISNKKKYKVHHSDSGNWSIRGDKSLKLLKTKSFLKQYVIY